MGVLSKNIIGTMLSLAQLLPHSRVLSFILEQKREKTSKLPFNTPTIIGENWRTKEKREKKFAGGIGHQEYKGRTQATNEGEWRRSRGQTTRSFARCFVPFVQNRMKVCRVAREERQRGRVSSVGRSWRGRVIFMATAPDVQQLRLDAERLAASTGIFIVPWTRCYLLPVHCTYLSAIFALILRFFGRNDRLEYF